MSNSSILGGSHAAEQADGKDIDLLGPSDSSDSGSDVQNEHAMSTEPDNTGEWGAVLAGRDTDSDADGTGERASADGDAPIDGADIMPDRIIDALGTDDDPASRRKSVQAGELALDEDGDLDDDPDATES